MLSQFRAADTLSSWNNNQIVNYLGKLIPGISVKTYRQVILLTFGDFSGGSVALINVFITDSDEMDFVLSQKFLGDSQRAVGDHMIDEVKLGNG